MLSRSARAATVFVFGFALGGIAVAVLADVVPDVMSRFMQNMMERMSDGERGRPEF